MSESIFVVQHHLARADHYDVRLEIGGVLVSWAVPKGPSLDPGERRLARRVDDHELAHADVEGVFGGQPKQVWDRGTFTVRGAGTAADGLAAGHLSDALHGVKLRGGWTFLRTRGDDRDWLLVKKRDAHADPHAEITRTAPESVLTGRTMEEIAAEG